MVVDHQGRPVAGALISPSCLALGSAWEDRTRSDERGRFACRNLRAGPVRLFVQFGNLHAERVFVADGSPEEVQIKLPARPEPNQAIAAQGVLQPVPIGQPAPEWLFAASSDGRLRTLAEQRGRMVVLYFWNVSNALSVSHLSVLAQLRNQFEPRGVFFLAIHGPGEDEKLVRRVLEFKRAPLLWAMDLERQTSNVLEIGATARQYGVGTFPLVVGIDKDGKVAFRGDPRGWTPKLAPAEQNGKPEPNRARTEEALNEAFKRELAGQIQRLVDRKD